MTISICCKYHPAYEALMPPVTGCPECEQLYKLVKKQDYALVRDLWIKPVERADLKRVIEPNPWRE